jgi:hypothetical protein
VFLERDRSRSNYIYCSSNLLDPLGTKYQEECLALRLYFYAGAQGTYQSWGTPLCQQRPQSRRSLFYFSTGTMFTDVVVCDFGLLHVGGWLRGM